MIDLPDSILTISNLSNSYGGSTLLENINFSLQQGEILCLLGRSGSGKTSLLRLIAGLEQSDSGTIIFNNKDLHNTQPHQREFGMMFQEYALFPHKNVKENISYGLEMKKFAATDKENQIQKMLSLVGMSGFEKRRIEELSGGEQQRVALARCLAPHPRLLLLDEPLGSLDRTLRDRLTMEIRSILKQLGVTAIFVTHDQLEAFSVADKIAILQEGKIGQLDIPEQLYKYPANAEIAQFLGFSNLIRGKIHNTLFHSTKNNFAVSLPKNIASSSDPQQEMTLLLRPEGAQLKSAVGADQGKLIHLSGEVISKYYLGSHYRVSFITKGISLGFDLPLDPPPPESGEEIKIAIPSSSAAIITG